jgi:PAS domain S-box-containing protein
MPPCIRILVVDDHEPIRRSISSLLSARTDVDFCGEAVDGIDAVEKTRELRPNVILMDVSMPRMDGLEATRVILRECPETRVIIVSQNDPTVVRRQALDAGASGYVSKAALSRDLVTAIDEIVDEIVDEARTEDRKTSVGNGGTSPTWFEGGGRMTEMMRATDWSKTPLGASESWSPALRMMVNFMLANRFPQLLWWGPQFCSLYNDAYVPILGEKHPWAIGRPVSEVWHEIWHVLKPLIETPFQGGPATWMDDIELVLNRRGFLEETHFTVAYSPVPDETAPGGIGGVLATVHEITENVIGERRIAALGELGAASAESQSPEEACSNAARILARHSKDFTFALLYLLNSRERSARLAGSTGLDMSEVARLENLDDLDSKVANPWPVAKIIETEQIYLIEDIRTIQQLPEGTWSGPTTAAAMVPIRSNFAHQLAGFMIVGISPCLQFDESYRNFLELMSTQIATTIANARAFEQERSRAKALAEIDRAKTAFFSNVSHEFRTPLSLMLGPLEDLLARSHTDLAPAAKMQLEMVNRNGIRLLRLVNNLLDFSRIESGRAQIVCQPTDLAGFTAELASVFRSAIERAGLQLKINCPTLSKPVYVDREMWEKIVLNLISNALKFTFEGEIAISLVERDDIAELRVHDTGVGIPGEEMPRLFERFHRIENVRSRTHEGSGIGLALVHELVKLHEGALRAESTPGRGSTFIVTVPLGADHIPIERIGNDRTMSSTAVGASAFVEEALRWLPAAAVSEEEMPSPNELLAIPCPPTSKLPSGRPRLLVADDNSDMRQYLVRLMSERYEVEAVPDGLSALESARTKRPDLILSDVMMPRLDGLGLLRELRADPGLSDVPIILLSARAGEESRLEGVEAGADDYLIKPFSARELTARVEAHMKMQRIRQQARLKEQRLSAEYETLLNQAPLGVYLVDSNFRIRQVNPVALPAFGNIPDLIGREFDEVVRRLWGRGYADEIVAAFHRTLETGEPYAVAERGEQRLDRGTKEYYEWRIDRVTLPDETFGVVCYFRDISGQVMARRALAESEDRYRGLAETLEEQVRMRTEEVQERTADIVKQSEEVRHLSAQLLKSQDEERRHIARELHDSAGQTLAALSMQISQIKRDASQNPEQLADTLRGADELVQSLTNEIRTTSYLLHPPLLDENGLSSALSWYVEGLAERSGLEIDLQISDNLERLPRDMELVLFRFVQECLTNVHRHSESKSALIRIRHERDMVHAEVEDRGKGMPTERLAEIQSRGTGVGIRGMRERVRHFQGTLHVESSAAGTKVSARLPIRSDGLNDRKSNGQVGRV